MVVVAVLCVVWLAVSLPLGVLLGRALRGADDVGAVERSRRAAPAPVPAAPAVPAARERVPVPLG